MLSGKDALAAIDETLQRVRGGTDEADQLCARASAERAELGRTEIGIFTRLATLRLLAIERGDLLQSLDDADRRASEILAERDHARGQNAQAIKSAEAELAIRERRRAEQQAVVATASEAVDAAEAVAQQGLAADAEYQAQFERAKQADFVADQAEDKAAAAQNDRVEKGKPYESDPLFAYLCDRGYGTASYRAWPLTRWLDAHVARLCGYEPARRNYALLTGIPPRLTEHAMKMRAHSDRELEALQKIERQAAERAGVPAKQAYLDEVEKSLSEIDDSVTEQERVIAALIEERGRFSAGTDDHSERCVATLSEALRRADISLLRERATRTPDREDDELVAQLATLVEERRRIERDLDQLKRLHQAQNARLQEFEDLRRRFKAERYDGLHSTFANGALIQAVLAQFLSGAISAGDVWATVERQQRRQRIHADPSFGTLGFPHAPKGGPWHMPRGGGFKTGGGFRGGGFRTGGKF